MKVWKFSSGYGKIRIMGKYPERLVNRCIESGVSLKNCERCSDGILADIRLCDFSRLRPLVRGTGLRARIEKRRGPSVLAAAAARSAAFSATLAAMAILIFIASQRIWFIRIGSVSVDGQEIRETLELMGIERGVSKRGVSVKAISDELNKDPRIANAKVALNGVTLSVELTETQTGLVEEEGSAPAEIIADKDCVISFIAVQRGRALVTAGTAVKKGDVLISGDLSGEKEGYFVRADGMILGEAAYSASANALRCIVGKTRTGESKKLVAIRLFGRELRQKPPYGDYELEPVWESGFDASLIPIGIRVYECFELKATPVIDTDGGVCERARLAAQEKLFALIPKDAGIIAIRTSCTLNPDGSVTAVVTAAAVEKIGSRREY